MSNSKSLKKLQNSNKEDPSIGSKYQNDHDGNALTIIFDQIIDNPNLSKLRITHNLAVLSKEKSQYLSEIIEISKIFGLIKQRSLNGLNNSIPRIFQLYPSFKIRHPVLFLNFVRLMFIVFFNKTYQKNLLRTYSDINVFLYKTQYRFNLDTIISNKFFNKVNLTPQINDFQAPIFKINSSNIMGPIQKIIERITSIYSDDLLGESINDEENEEDYSPKNLQDDEKIFLDLVKKDPKNFYQIVSNDKVSKILVETYIKLLIVPNLLDCRFIKYLELKANTLKENSQSLHRKEYSFNILKTFLKKQLSNKKLSKYGSYVIGLSSPDSDIDVALLNGADIYDKVLQKLKSNPSYEILEIRPDAKIPIIRFSDKINLVKFDLSFKIGNSHPSSEFFISILKGKENLKSLILLVKHYTEKANIKDASQGYFSSHALTIMAIYFYKTLVKSNLNIYDLLHSFFLFYIKFDYNKIISINKKEIESFRSFGTKIKIKDVIDKNRNVASGIKLSNFKKIMVEFSRIEYQLRNYEEFIKYHS
ncbi:hypothetical protein DICPUDRAFT_157248 [Dictyostelium purpureum]|uniref:Poly(A) RNA polymerase mitochondrial-like central palm domain-containing protein n=1 Tax=Dictyostelium purpureum TaxID=5786 RepID=F0ZYM9_DICPU|nr:uncharacterized protein DICPUDRAFT_157248 [Dictyostelium purpureum]EGC30949.1 hypothetical protein DICPUDRAFT_157248 [Dictyostelium purpureum]|eukprot:XP_003292526.1 hypothetical protein DICPUDRAFT_157248 [Dictyostelium purpureum]